MYSRIESLSPDVVILVGIIVHEVARCRIEDNMFSISRDGRIAGMPISLLAIAGNGYAHRVSGLPVVHEEVQESVCIPGRQVVGIGVKSNKRPLLMAAELEEPFPWAPVPAIETSSMSTKTAGAGRKINSIHNAAKTIRINLVRYRMVSPPKQIA